MSHWGLNANESDAIYAIEQYNKHGNLPRKLRPFGANGPEVYKEFIERGALSDAVAFAPNQNGLFGSQTINFARKYLPALIAHGFLSRADNYGSKRVTKLYRAHIPPLAKEALRRKQIWDDYYANAVAAIPTTGSPGDFIAWKQQAERSLGWTYSEWFGSSLTESPVPGIESGGGAAV
jgi:hypothetical protein